MMKRLFTLLVIPALFASVIAKADEKPTQPKPGKPPAKAPKKGERRLASVNYNNRNEYRSTRGTDQKNGLEFKLGVAAGAGMQNDSSTSGGSQDVGMAPTVGITADIRNWKYVGIEEDAYFQAAGSTPEISGSKDSTQGLGSFTTLKTQYAFQWGSIKFTPKAGLGFAYQRRTTSSVSSASSVETSLSAMGVFGMVGFDLEPFRNVTLSADYARSVISDIEIKSGTVEQTANNGKFDRIRAGAFFQFMPGMHGGLQFVQRSISFNVPTLSLSGGTDSTQRLRQFQAVFQYDL